MVDNSGDGRLPFEDDGSAVPSREEISSMYKSKKKNAGKPAPTHSTLTPSSYSNSSNSTLTPSSLAPVSSHHAARMFAYLFSLILVLAVVGAAGYYAYQYRSSIQDAVSGDGSAGITGNVVGAYDGGVNFLTGFVTNDLDYEDPSRFTYELEGVVIDLANEEVELTNSLTNSLTSSLTATCKSEKSDLEKNVRSGEQTICSRAKNSLKDEIDKQKEKYDDAKDDLDQCEDDLAAV
ncbi:MAG: hypothetical protein ACI83O_000174 [Patescibacteria group bacterium]|jgi:hypothetical protein